MKKEDYILCGNCEKEFAIPEKLELTVECPDCGYSAKTVEAQNQDNSRNKIHKTFFFIFMIATFTTLSGLIFGSIFAPIRSILLPMGILCIGVLLGMGAFFLLDRIQLQEVGKQLCQKTAIVLYILGSILFVVGIFLFSLPSEGMGPIVFLLIILFSYIPLAVAVVLSYLATINGIFLVGNIFILISPFFLYLFVLGH